VSNETLTSMRGVIARTWMAVWAEPAKGKVVELTNLERKKEIKFTRIEIGEHLHLQRELARAVPSWRHAS
jgi:hypothetical protein